jgi:DNA-binding NtrC family response regulator
VIVVSAERTSVTVHEVFDAGALDFVAKPFTRDRIVAALKRAIPPELLEVD